MTDNCTFVKVVYNFIEKLNNETDFYYPIFVFNF